MIVDGDWRSFTLTEAEYVELLGALELAHTAAGLVPGSDADARQRTITEIINIVTEEETP